MIKDLTDKIFYNFKVLKLHHIDKKSGKSYWLCRCKCGNLTVKQGYAITNNDIKSCGCKMHLPIHNMSRSRFYRIFNGIKIRCNNKKDTGYYRYGGRGIKCEWKDFMEFKKDMYKSYLYHIKKYGEKDTSIDRIDNNGNYCKENCRWATRKENINNISSNVKITFKGKTKNLGQWAEILNINYGSLRGRIFTYKWSIEKALTTPIKEYKRNDNKRKLPPTE